jgi:hypothetical protein
MYKLGAGSIRIRTKSKHGPHAREEEARDRSRPLTRSWTCTLANAEPSLTAAMTSARDFNGDVVRSVL